MLDGNKLKESRTKRQPTETDLASMVGVTRSYVAMLESGARRSASLQVVAPLADAFGVSIMSLIAKGNRP